MIIIIIIMVKYGTFGPVLIMRIQIKTEAAISSLQI
jgi:hypothetical protein